VKVLTDRACRLDRKRRELKSDCVRLPGACQAPQYPPRGCVAYCSVIRTRVADDDPSLDALLDLDGQQFTIEPSGYTVKFAVRRVPATAERPYGISYSLTMHAPDGARLVGFDNAHVVRASRGPAGARTELDHLHRLGTTRPYRYSEAGQLLEDFWREVYAALDNLGVER